MNYRHAFHAGNHTEVFKHAALVFVLEHLRQKPQPFGVLDTHAGLGFYDLASTPAQKTREYEQGIGKLFGPPLPAAQTYLDLIAALNPAELAAYPGSPEIVRRLLRDQDRLAACELHPEDAETLRRRYRDDPRVAVHHRDGYEALLALIPPPERRGLVFIDPPYEAKDEADRLARALTKALRKWPTGVFMAWYPIKDRAIADTLAKAATDGGFPKALRAEFLPYPPDGLALAGGGLIVCNAPYQLDVKLTALCQALAPILGDGQGRWSVEMLTPA
jgi:23S rRNA (adenine2030-N6)-methyltransferase